MRSGAASTPFLKAVLAAALLAAALTAGSAAAAEEIHRETQSYLMGSARSVHVNLTLGEVRVEGSEASRVELEYRLVCIRDNVEKCRREGERVRVVPRVRGDRFVVGLRNARRGRLQGVKVDLRLKVPRDVPLDIDLEGGNVFVTRMRADVVIAGAQGDIDVIAPRERFGEVDVKVVAGKAELWLGDGYLKGAGFPKSIRWNGPGSSRIEVDLGTGDVRVRLE